MTGAQKQLYFRSWAAVVRTHDWRGSGETLSAQNLDSWVSPDLNRVYQAVWNAASGLAWQDNRSSIAASDLRHACHVVAIGRPVSSKRFTNSEVDRVLALFRLLADPDNLRNVDAWQDIDAGERKRHVHVITQASPAYWQRIASDKFGHTDLDRLPLEQLRHLSLTIRQRLRRIKESRDLEAEARAEIKAMETQP